MATCAHCKTEQTQLYSYGVPVCIKCADIRAKASLAGNADAPRDVIIQQGPELSTE
jgi:hypothetical protein